MFVFGTTGVSFGVIISFDGGTAYLSPSGFIVTDNTNVNYDVDYYVEDGVTIDFIGADGIIGDYYGIGSGPDPLNSVIHVHWNPVTSVVFSKENGNPFDLNYAYIASNTQIGGGAATGNELSYITTSGGYQLLLPPSDWGFDFDYFGQPGDGVVQLFFDSNFDGITSFTITSQNAYCFGMDEFYIDQPAPGGPAPIPAPAAILLGSIGVSLVGWLRRRGAV